VAKGDISLPSGQVIRDDSDPNVSINSSIILSSLMTDIDHEEEVAMDDDDDSSMVPPTASTTPPNSPIFGPLKKVVAVVDGDRSRTIATQTALTGQGQFLYVNNLVEHGGEVTRAASTS
jgi:hypothetical protein